MTRINVVPPEELFRQHLLAEYRELPRVFNLVRKAVERGELPGDPRNPVAYRLGKGHVRFFYPRLGFLAFRQETIVREMIHRGFKPAFIEPMFEVHKDIPQEWWGLYEPTDTALLLNRARIAERLLKGE